MLSQTSLDASIGDLVTAIQQAYELILKNGSPSKINSSKDVLVKIAQVVQDCSQFVIKYSETKSFCASVMPVIFITISSFFRVSSREECSLRDIYQSRQLQLGATGADARASKLPSSKYPIWFQTNLWRYCLWLLGTRGQSWAEWGKEVPRWHKNRDIKRNHWLDQ